MIKGSSANSIEILSVGACWSRKNTDYACSRLPASGSGRGFDSPHLHREAYEPEAIASGSYHFNALLALPRRTARILLEQPLPGGATVYQMLLYDLPNRLFGDIHVEHRAGIYVQ
jgi:hypothetical protein